MEEFLKQRLPAWLLILWTCFWGIPEWREKVSFWANLVSDLGGIGPMIAVVLESPLFPIGIALFAISYLFFSRKQRGRHKSPSFTLFLAWLLLAIIFFGSVALIFHEYIRSTAIQGQLATVSWKLTDAQREAFASAIKSEKDIAGVEFYWIQASPTARTMAIDASIVARANGWGANAMGNRILPVELIGIHILVPIDERGEPIITERVKQYSRIFKNAGLPHKITKMRGIAATTVHIVFGHKPQ